MKYGKILSLILIIFFPLRGNTLNSKEVLYSTITAKSGLHLRATPSVKGKKITIIPFDYRLTVLKNKGPEIVIAGKKGRWTKVQWRALSGWVFSGFLSPEERITDKQLFEERVLQVYNVLVNNLKLKDFISTQGVTFEYYSSSRADAETKGTVDTIPGKSIDGTIRINVKNYGTAWGSGDKVKERVYVLKFNFRKEMFSWFKHENPPQYNPIDKQLLIYTEQYRVLFTFRKEMGQYLVYRISYKDEDPG